MPLAKEIIDVMAKHHWTAEQWPNGLWIIGPEDTEGVINVLGAGLDFMEAFNKALEVGG